MTLSGPGLPIAWLHPAEPWPLVGIAMIVFWLLVLAAVLWYVRTRWPKDPGGPTSAGNP